MACIQLNANGAHLIFEVDGWHLSFMLVHLLEILCHTVLVSDNGAACTTQSLQISLCRQLEWPALVEHSCRPNGPQQTWQVRESLGRSGSKRSCRRAQARSSIFTATADPWTSCRLLAPL